MNRELFRIGSSGDQTTTVLRDTAENPAVKSGHLVVRYKGEFWSVPDVRSGWTSRKSANSVYDAIERRLFLEPVEPDAAEEFAEKTGTPLPREAALTGSPDVGGEQKIDSTDPEKGVAQMSFSNVRPSPGKLSDREIAAALKARGFDPAKMPRFGR